MGSWGRGKANYEVCIHLTFASSPQRRGAFKILVRKVISFCHRTGPLALGFDL